MKYFKFLINAYKYMSTQFLKHFQYTMVNQWLELFSMLNTFNIQFLEEIQYG